MSRLVTNDELSLSTTLLYFEGQKIRIVWVIQAELLI